jgi:hypothetical protein
MWEKPLVALNIPGITEVNHETPALRFKHGVTRIKKTVTDWKTSFCPSKKGW